MKFTIEVEPDKSPDGVGEFLRSQFFAEEVGCYSCFDWAEGVEPLDSVPVCPDEGDDAVFEDIQWTRGRKKFGEEYVECRKDADVIDEIPGAYKNIDAVMAAQGDLVDVVHTLRQIVCVKG